MQWMSADQDAELTSAMADDLAAGFEAMVRAYQHRLYAFALAMSGEPADAEEIAQDAFLRAHAALRRYPADRIRALQLSAWLHRIAINVFRNRIRRRTLRLVPLEPEPALADPSAGPERQALSRAALRELANLVSGLPLHQRAAVVLRCVQGMTYAEVAELLGQPEGTIKSNVHRGLQALRRRAGWLSEVS
jgi:RNA polymerase sigma-70 factor, ECF subfamily